MNIHRALLRSDEFAALADEIPGLELPRTFTLAPRGRSSGFEPGEPGGPDAVEQPGTARLSRLSPEALDALRFLLVCHQFSTVGLSLRAQTKSTVLIGEYSVSYGLVSGLCRTAPAVRDRRSKYADAGGSGSADAGGSGSADAGGSGRRARPDLRRDSRLDPGRDPGRRQETAVQVCAMPARKLPGEITTSIWQLRDHDRADVGVTIVPRAGGRDAKWLAAHSICCLFTRKRRFADQPDIDGMIAEICREDTPEKRARDEAVSESLAGRE